MNGSTTIQVSRSVRDRIAKFGEAGESMNEALLRILNIAEEAQCMPVHTCAVCGRTMSSREYEEKGCIYCGADTEN